ncbi:MAG: U32 family peptidase, partial [Candidatus Diapherotrites archaeon]|nr:U32 family peptidase [Candidatus Diapherotrites archaeon]
ECLQSCRREWKATEEDGFEIVFDGDRFLSAKDLCLIGHLPELFATGAVSFKIEGRMKDVLYAETVARVYREAFDAVDDGSYSDEKVEKWTAELNKVFNRGFSTGFAFGIPGKDAIQHKEHGTVATHVKKMVGEVVNFYRKPSVAEVKLFADGVLKVGDDVVLESKTTFLHQKVKSLQVEQDSVDSAQGVRVGLLVEEPVPVASKVFIVVAREGGDSKN